MPAAVSCLHGKRRSPTPQTCSRRKRPRPRQAGLRLQIALRCLDLRRRQPSAYAKVMKRASMERERQWQKNLRRRKANPSREAEFSKMRGEWLLGAIPVPPPEGPLMLKLKDVDADLSSRIKDDKVMSFHLTGCTGNDGNGVPGRAVAEAMAVQAEDGRAGGGSEAAKAADFSSIGAISSTRARTRKIPNRGHAKAV